MTFGAVDKFFFVKSGIDNSNEIPLILPEIYKIRIDGYIVDISKYLTQRFECLSKHDVSYRDFSQYFGTDCTLEISRVVGNIHYDTDFMKNKEKAIVGHMRGYFIESSNPPLINPKTVADLCINYPSEEWAYLNKILRKCVNAKDVKIPQVSCKLDTQKFIDYILGSRDRVPDLNSTLETYLYPMNITFSKPFYDWLETRHVK